MKMSESFEANYDVKDPVYEVPLKDIYVNYDFNCRGGKINKADCSEIIKSIKANKLQQAVRARRLTDEQKAHWGTDKPFMLIMGFRRYVSVETLGWETIPCVIDPPMSDSAAKQLNLVENLNRTDLTIMQEANTLSYFKEAGLTIRDISVITGKGENWISVRLMLLNMPEEIQIMADHGQLNPTNVRDLYTLKDKAAQIEAAKKIKQAKIRGDNIPKIRQSQEKKTNPNIARSRSKGEMLALQQWFHDHDIPIGFHNRLLAWAAGVINDRQLKDDIAQEFSVPNDGEAFPLKELDHAGIF